MGQKNLPVLFLVLTTLLEGFRSSALSNGKSSSSTTILENVTMPCPALQVVVRNDGTFDIVYWSICTSRRCDHLDTTWDWIAGMNNKGITQVGRERVNITSDGALEIRPVNRNDTGKYMCTVKTINHSSPKVHHTTLVVIKDAVSNGKTSSPTAILENVTMPCPALQEVVRNDGTFDIMYWSICTSRSCDHQDTTWDWIAGMNNKGITQVARERVNITSDGALEIHQVQLNDTGRYMCTVKTINHSSPEVHHTTLVVIKDVLRSATNQQDIQATKKQDAKDCKQDYSENSESHVDTMTITASALSLLLILAVGYIVYLKRYDLRCWNQGSSSAQESVSGVNGTDIA